MGLIKICKDGFRGKPDFSNLLHNVFQIDDLVLSFECPNNIYEGHVYQDLVELKQFDVDSKVERHEQLIKLASIYFSFQKKILNPLLPINKQGGLYIRLRIKSANESIHSINQLSLFIEKEYVEFYHALESPDGSKQGDHTEMMNDAIDYANHRWGLEPINEEKKRAKEEFLVGEFLRGYPPIKCQAIDVGEKTYSKYVEGNLEYKKDYRRVYNLHIKNEFYFSIEFLYEIEPMFAQKKFLDWVRSADETFEKKVLELLELSPLVDSYTTSKVERLTKQN
ncbi:TPA: DNAase [Vibrio parahaemolyticus]|uniref:DNAase n=2 Tax=Vibrio parahaemolyticus TaxID=670 RepID=A0A7Z2MX10_VIBPH|nr:DNAase [Vibrio parahaemolyticus]MCR9723323.1 DNAase [Vibrio parahaemolyticus]MCR9741666.1 DNAase [Vibrio parahaemolyticus]QHH11399.1 DNAase [Vibrio parahaemolyticus]HAS6671074.1 DNAase [Vibrio parahaemolyticus]HAS6676927.1 DNAase [Vibrio parahaemolyticus]